MATRTYVPEAGDIVWLQFDPQAGHEQAGHRPALVLSPAAYNVKKELREAREKNGQLALYISYQFYEILIFFFSPVRLSLFHCLREIHQ